MKNGSKIGFYGVKLHGLGQNQISSPREFYRNSIYKNDQRNKINIFGDSESVMLVGFGPVSHFFDLSNGYDFEFDDELS